jgi:flagellum-specific peptidoglycan hydrolase FlgJ
LHSYNFARFSGRFEKRHAWIWSVLAAGALVIGTMPGPFTVACAQALGADGMALDATTAQASPIETADLTAEEVTESQFFQIYGAEAQTSAVKTGAPASVTLAQAALESDWGDSRLSKDAKNFFGIKAIDKEGTAGVVYMNTWEVVNGKNIVISQPFRAYHSAAESFTDHGLFFQENRRYSGALRVKDDAQAFARAIANAGYATDPAYATKLIKLMDKFNLYQFDAPVKEQQAAAPAPAQSGVVLASAHGPALLKSAAIGRLPVAAQETVTAGSNCSSGS